MSSLRLAASRLLPQASKSSALVPVRTTIISAPARNKVSFLEKACHGAVIAVGCCAIPGWILINMKHYRGRPE